MEKQQHKSYVRFTLAQRLEHFVLMVSFTVLALTGIPQKYVGRRWAEEMISLMGGIEMVRNIHHIAAVVLMLVSIYHVVAVGYRLFVLRVRPSILPHPKDIIDFLDDVRYNLGLAKHRPQMDRYTYGEKIEYWAVVWGTLLMAVTGFMMWNPITTTRFLPGEVIPAAKAAHGGEALLAILAIITWHSYHVHLRHFNKSIFTGKLTEEEMREEHPLELARIEAGQGPTLPDEETRRRRERIYLPVAAMMSLALLWGLYEFVTFEETAITTLPRQSTVVAFVPATPTPGVTRVPSPTPVIQVTATPSPQGSIPVVAVPHALAGQEHCLMCHGIGAMKPFPEDHTGRGNETCLSCHAPADESQALPTVELPAVPSFSTEVLPLFQARCVVCHGDAAGLRLTSYEDLMKGSVNGPVVVPGRPDASRLVQKISEAHPTQMAEEDLAVVQAWIGAGAPNN